MWAACLNGHALEPKVVRGSICARTKKCYRCCTPLLAGQLRHTCKPCRYHLCDRCWTSYFDAGKASRIVGSPRSGDGGLLQAVAESTAQMRACRYGAACFQTSAEHLAQFAHPGDHCYRKGVVSFEENQLPEFETVRQLFEYHDPNQTGYLTKRHFAQAVATCKDLLPPNRDAFSVRSAWSDAGGDVASFGYIDFGRFAEWTEMLGLELPVGLEVPRCRRPCRGFSGGFRCKCSCFQPLDASAATECMNSQQLCSCGHKASAHRSDWAELSFHAFRRSLRSTLPMGTDSGVIAAGLQQVDDLEVLSNLQTLLWTSHKATDNWTRDRGCLRHGVNGCSVSCAASNRTPVPRRYLLRSAYRNVNADLWERYAVARAAITKECQDPNQVPFCGEVPVATQHSSSLGALDPACNELRLLHGAAVEKCRSICSSNFQLQFAGTGATWKDAGCAKGMPLYGFGIYLAEHITKADEYAVEDDSDGSDRLYYVLLCRAVAGRYKRVTSNDIDIEGLRKCIFEGPFHSVLGDRVSGLGKPFREFVVYEPAQCFPEFLICYQREYS